MRYDFNEVIDRHGTNAISYEACRLLRPELPVDFLPMWVADMEFASPPEVLSAMRARLDRRVLGYTGLFEADYFDAVTGWMRRRYGWEVGAEQIVYSSGIVTAIEVAVEHLTEPGDGILLMTPAYHPFDDSIKRFARTPVYNRLVKQNGRYEIDFEDFERKARDPHTRLFFLCNPQNPTGRVFDEATLRRLGEICFQNDVFVVSDEIHADLLRVGKTHIPFGKLFPGEKRLIVCTAPSKTFNIAGNQHANLLIPDPGIRAKWQEHRYCGQPNCLSVPAVIAAYTLCDEWLTELRAYLDGNFACLKAFVDDELPRARFSVPDGTYLAWLDLSGYGLSDAELKACTTRAGLFIQFAEDFVENGTGHARMNISCPRARLQEGLHRLQRALQ